jgi:hypothetical protein
LQRHASLKSSFNFIADALTAARGDFYALPGKRHDLAVTVATKAEKAGSVVEAIYVGRQNVLRLEDVARGSDDGKPQYRHMYIADLEAQLCSELIVPARLLKITYTPVSDKKPEELRFPMGGTVRRVCSARACEPVVSASGLDGTQRVTKRIG